jgi:hypothetical protein
MMVWRIDADVDSSGQSTLHVVLWLSCVCQLQIVRDPKVTTQPLVSGRRYEDKLNVLLGYVMVQILARCKE